MNEFSPRESNTKWMAILHSFVVIGVMVGYIVGAIAVNVLEDENDGKPKYGIKAWRYAFMLQGYFMIVIGLFFLCADNSALDIFKKIKNINEHKSPFELHKEGENSSGGNGTPDAVAMSRGERFERVSNIQSHM